MFTYHCMLLGNISLKKKNIINKLFLLQCCTHIDTKGVYLFFLYFILFSTIFFSVHIFILVTTMLDQFPLHCNSSQLLKSSNPGLPSNSPILQVTREATCLSF